MSRVGIRSGQSDAPNQVRPRFLGSGRVRTEGICSSTGPGSGSVSSMSIVGRIGLSSRFTRYISGRTESVLGLSEISNIWWIEMGSVPIKLIQLSAFPISMKTPLGRRRRWGGRKWETTQLS